MLIININPSIPSPSAMRQAATLLRCGGVVIYPTDTAYALGGRYDLPSVVRRVLEIKGRRDRKFTLIASSMAQVRRHFQLSRAARRWARLYWPGSFSIVVSPRFAVRVPDLPIARLLARLAGAPLIATSANRSGGPTPYSVRTVMRQLRHRLTHTSSDDIAVVDAGRLPKRKPSTILRVDGKGKAVVIRAGEVVLRSYVIR